MVWKEARRNRALRMEDPRDQRQMWLDGKRLLGLWKSGGDRRWFPFESGRRPLKSREGEEMGNRHEMILLSSTLLDKGCGLGRYTRFAATISVDNILFVLQNCDVGKIFTFFCPNGPLKGREKR